MTDTDMTSDPDISAEPSDARIVVKIFGDRNTCTRLLREALTPHDQLRICGDGSYHRRSLAFLEDTSATLQLDLVGDERNRLMQLASDIWDSRRKPLETWKHREVRFHPSFARAAARVIFTTKHPGAWLVSLHRRSYDRLNSPIQTEDFSTFLREEWLAVARERGPKIYRNPIEIWNRKMASYLTFAQKAAETDARTLFLPAEDITGDPSEAAARLDAFLDLPEGSVIFPSASTKDSSKTSAFYADYYGRQVWREKISAEDWNFIQDNIDWDIAEQLGYSA